MRSICNFILLSLFVAVILENFDVAEEEKMLLQVLIPNLVPLLLHTKLRQACGMNAVNL